MSNCLFLTLNEEENKKLNQYREKNAFDTRQQAIKQILREALR
jgi:hypothetical protein